MDVLVDDVGSFPLPSRVGRKLFDEAYVRAREAIRLGLDVERDSFLLESFYSVVLESFRRKLAAGLDVVSYPQLYDMHRQVTDVVASAMGRGTYVVDGNEAIVPEVWVLNAEARELCE
jgi:hypothetical protein